MKAGVWNVKLGWLYVPKDLVAVGDAKVKINGEVYDGKIDTRRRLFCKALKTVLREGMVVNVRRDGEYYIVELPTAEEPKPVEGAPKTETVTIEQPSEAQPEQETSPTSFSSSEDKENITESVEVAEAVTVEQAKEEEKLSPLEIKWNEYKREHGFSNESVIFYKNYGGFRKVTEEEVLKLLEKGEYIKDFVIENSPLPRVFIREEKRLFDLFRLLNEFDDEEVFKVEYDGLTVKTMDPSHVMLIVASIPSVDLKEFEASRDFDFAVRIDEVCKSFNPRKNDEVKLEAEKYGKVKITVGNITKTFSQLAIDPDEIPQLKIFFDGYFRMNVNELYRIIKSFGDSNVTIIIDGGNVKFEAKNSDGEVIEAKLEDEYLIDVDGSAKSTYDARRLADVLKHLKNLTLTIKVSIANNKPIMIETLEGYPITIYIAPYVE
jgi:DNA polymerase III sliding clamp (beta) subunit (PCNA family)